MERKNKKIISVVERISKIAAELDEIDQLSDQLGAANRRKQILFAEYGSLFNDLDVAQDAENQELIVKSLRPRFKLEIVPVTGVAILVQSIRTILASLAVIFGCTTLVMLIPLRWLHPLFREFGVPNGKLPMDILARFWCACVLAAAGVTLTIEGKNPNDRWRAPHEAVPNGIVTYNHTSNLDAFCVQLAGSPMCPKYIAKKEIFMMPWFGWSAMAMGSIAVNRGIRAKAIPALNASVKSVMQKWKRSVAIAPEGTRSKDGTPLLPFKKGPFHMQVDTGTPLLPMILFGAYELSPPGALLHASGRVTVRIIDAIEPDATRSPDDTRRLLQTNVVNALADKPVGPLEPLTLNERVWELSLNTFTICWSALHIYSMVVFANYYDLGVLGMALVIIAFSMVISFIAAWVY
eukprot:m.43358 g.43358  ORF g.43358 m.43358 type:complete len:407 (+) comp19358_c0_seq2:158-1378(+)